jgi:hypothetical protein
MKRFEIFAAIAMQPKPDFLVVFLEMTGLLDETHKAARALQTAIEDGTIRRDGTHEDAWPIAYRALLGASDDDERVDEAFRSYGADVYRMIATEALRPYLRSETDAPPPPPEGPAGTLAADWSQWLELAELVRNSSLIADPPTDLKSLAMTAGLLLAAGKADALAIMLAGTEPSHATINLARYFVRRLDRGCASYLWHPGEAVVSIQIYKFDNAGEWRGRTN